MKSSNLSHDKLVEHGRAIARGMEKVKVEREKYQAKAVQRKAEKLSQAAERLFNPNIK